MSGNAHPSRTASPINASAALYSFAWAATLADQFARVPLAGDAAGIAILAFLLKEFPRQRRYAQVLFAALAAAGLAGIAASPGPAPLFLAAWRRGAAYAAFFLALSSLRDAAQTSPLVRRCGRHLVAQPPGRRYAALTAGGHLFGIILSYGAIDLLGAMVTRANTAGSDAARALRSRRMLMAIYRGFTVMNCWNPINLMTAVVSTAVPAAPMRLLMPAAFAVSLGMAAIGWAEDRAIRGRPGAGPRPRTTESWAVHLRIAALVAIVMLLAELGSALLGVSLVAAVTLIVPLVGLAWAVAQNARFIAQAPVAHRGAATDLNRAAAAILCRAAAVILRRTARFARRVPAFRGEATVLAGSGFMGVAVGGALPAAALAPLLAHLPPIAVPLLVPVLLIATGQLGLNPIALVALLGAAVPDPASLAIPPAALAFACMLGWGLAVNMTPMSASAITTARWAGVAPWTVATAWNWRFTLSGLFLSWAAIAAMFTLS